MNSSMTMSSGTLVRAFSHRHFVSICIGSGLLLRLLVAYAFPVEPFSDSAWYVARSHELLAGLGYQESGHPTAYWPVGWPAILAGTLGLVGNAKVAVVALNVLAALAIMLLILWYGRLVTSGELAGKVALLLYVVYPNHIAYTGQAATETVYTALLMGAFALLIAARTNVKLAIASGLIFGIATLVKPQSLLFPFGGVIAIWWIFSSFRWTAAIRTGVVVYIFLFLIVLPWSYRNYLVFGEFVLVSTNGGTALLIGANDDMTGSHMSWVGTPLEEEIGVPFKDRVSRQIEANNAQKRLAKEWIKENPVRYVAWMPKKLFLLWYKDTDGFWGFKNDYPQSTLLISALQLVNQLAYLVLLSIAAFAGLRTLRDLLVADTRFNRAGLLFCAPVFVSLLAVVFNGQIRYHFPAMPFIILIAGIWLTDPDRLRWHRRS